MSDLAAKADSFISGWSEQILSSLRIVSAFMFMQHGGQKVFGFPVEQRIDFVLVSLNPGLAGIMEIIGGFLLLVGLFTRQVAFVLSGLMAFAYWMAHAPRGFWTLANGGDSSVLYCFVFLTIAAIGGGCWSVDRLLRGKAA